MAHLSASESQPVLSQSISPFKRDTVDSKLLELLRKNYDIISVIADIERSDSPIVHSDSVPSLPLIESRASPNIMDRADAGDVSNSGTRRNSHTALGNSSSDTNLINNAKRRASLAVPLVQVASSSECSTLAEESMDVNPNSMDQDYRTSQLENEQSSIRSPKWGRWNEKFSGFCATVMDALSVTNDDIKAQNRLPDPPPKLSAYALRRDIKRCVVESHSYLETVAGIRDLFVWANPMASLSIFSIYMYSIYRGWLISLTLFLIILQLGFNFLAAQKGINFGLQLLPHKELQPWKFDLSGAQLVFDVARRAQVLLTFAGDCLEKFKFLFAWKRPEVTVKFLGIVSFFFLLSLVVSTGIWLSVVGFLIGGKAFIMTYLYHRFPRLQPIFDVIVYFYNNLPTTRISHNLHPTSKFQFGLHSPNMRTDKWLRTDGMCLSPMDSPRVGRVNHLRNNVVPNGVSPSVSPAEKRRCSISVIPMSVANCGSGLPSPMHSRPSTPLLTANRAFLPMPIHNAKTESNTQSASRTLSGDTQKSVELEAQDEAAEAAGGSATSSETDIFLDEEADVIKITRSCMLVDKSKRFPKGIDTGTAILSDRMISFRYQKPKDSRRLSQETLEIPFDEIIQLKKIRSLKTLFSLTSKGIELKLAFRKKSIQLVGISKRDEFYESLIETARIADVELATVNGVD
ncbi:GRAM domain-containing protein 4 [Ditylenchus destructor]|nr:GRAM domain-containing protein 4 [Ditylenchus destructor]